MNQFNYKHLMFKHPFTCMVAGPTSSGKTVLVRRILMHHKLLIDIPNFAGDKINVLWAFGQEQSLYECDLPNVHIEYVKGLPSKESIAYYKPHIIVIDDLMTELGDNKELANLFTKGSHHNNISVIFISQNIFHKGSQMRTINLNCHYTLIMNSPRDRAQIMHLGRQMFPGKTKFFQEAYEHATSKEFGYLKIDSKQDTPSFLRVQSCITPEEADKQAEIYKCPIIPKIYVPK